MPTLTERITKRPGRCGGAACVRETRYTVWGLVESQRLGLDNAGILTAHPDLTPEDLEAAWTYASEHAHEIEVAIWENEAVMFDQEAGPIPEAFLARGRELGLSEQRIRASFEPPVAE